MTLKDIFGSNVRAAREAQGLSRGDLADRARLAENTIARVERGEMGLSFENIEALAAALGLEPIALFSAEPPIESPPERTRQLQRIDVLLRRLEERELAKVGRVIKAMEG
ncbi:helix-turn-helix domain-containing protein [Salinarimonas rosea]|uniref:helix-turn-helix domain-containing protein n=1 Tax=Salinarimonas rosea TaxID=552063 RepID=UPI00040B265E|nr:helix-turn-helix transcriptional regulator [Salinarimonas rosea]